MRTILPKDAEMSSCAVTTRESYQFLIYPTFLLVIG